MTTLEDHVRKEMREMADRTFDDKEESHVRADGLLCELLIELGYSDIVADFERIGKWYA